METTPATNAADAFPGILPDLLPDAEERILEYLEIALDIYEEMRLDPERYATFRTLTARNGTATLGTPQGELTS